MRCIIAIIVQRKSFDAAYVRRLIHSDPDTEREFVAYFGELMAVKLRSRLRAPELIQDVTQETFLRVLRTLRESGIDNPEALGAFVNSVCTNVLFEVYRAQSRVTDPVGDRVSEEIPADSALAGEEEDVFSEIPTVANRANPTGSSSEIDKEAGQGLAGPGAYRMVRPATSDRMEVPAPAARQRPAAGRVANRVIIGVARKS